VFVAIPKTGSNTVQTFLPSRAPNHLKASMLQRFFGEEKFKNASSFCFIRNPFELIKSWYFYHKFSPNVIRPEVKAFYPPTFEEWCFDMKFRTHWEQSSHLQHNSYWDLSNPLFQRDWVCNSEGAVIVNSVHKFDNFSKVLRDLFDQQIPIKNKSENDQHQLSEECRNQIKKQWKTDIAFYDSLK